MVTPPLPPYGVLNPAAHRPSIRRATLRSPTAGSDRQVTMSDSAPVVTVTAPPSVSMPPIVAGWASNWLGADAGMAPPS